MKLADRLDVRALESNLWQYELSMKLVDRLDIRELESNLWQ
jgi:hypothetical protein